MCGGLYVPYVHTRIEGGIMPRHLCALCGQISFATYHEYEKHRAQAHDLKSAIMPERITGRTVTQIVNEAERTWLKPLIVPIDERKEAVNVHPSECKCMACFDIHWSKISASLQVQSETALVIERF